MLFRSSNWISFFINMDKLSRVKMHQACPVARPEFIMELEIDNKNRNLLRLCRTVNRFQFHLLLVTPFPVYV